VAAKSKCVRGDLEIELVGLNGRKIHNFVLASVVVFDINLELEWWDLIKLC